LSFLSSERIIIVLFRRFV